MSHATGTHTPLDTAPLGAAPPATAAAPGPSGRSVRRGDLDALRGFAMVLGIALHATLAYFPVPWPVQDPAQARPLGLLFALIHGFRMPLFFMLSGFFTMLVLRRRGLAGLLRQRALRILLPLAIAMVTIVPLDRAVMAWAVRQSTAATAARNPLVGSILAGDLATVRRALVAGSSPTAPDPQSGVTPLALAAMAGDVGIVTTLLDAGAASDVRNRDGSTPLHAAAFLGQADVVELLLVRGADPVPRDRLGKTPLEALAAPPELATVVGRFLGLEDRDEADLEAGRDRIRRELAPLTPEVGRRSGSARFKDRYRAALATPRWSFTIAGRSWQVFQSGIFDHLWFLWYLCWLVAAFALAEIAGVGPTGRFRWWLVPASCLPFSLMWSPFGPDTATGLLPVPHLLMFYGCFFWFGAATYAAEGAETPLGRRWPVVLPLAVAVLFPTAIATIGDRAVATILQPVFAWAMSLGLVGLFRRCFARERPAVRWLSDASYWMYLVHLPMVIVSQAALRDFAWPAVAKFVVVVVVVVAAALVTYRWCVRFTPIGWLLNGSRPT